MRNTRLGPPFPRFLLMKLNKDLDEISLYCPSHHGEVAEELPIHRMVLLLEDRRFFEHKGVDIWAFGRELFHIFTFRKHGGASTIDMQLVRTITGYRERTVARKLYEMILARLVQYHATKWQILQSYLDVAYFGTRLTGLQAASRRLYNKRVDQLSIEEAAELASLLVYPKPTLENDRWRSKMKRRSRYALYLRARSKKISK
ncbi:MAG: biosynthetic peptidoglycan transglycosylase [Rhodomicrobiaceae bacterium]